MKLIVGLGNPGKTYHETRHNVGFMAIDAFAEEQDANWHKENEYKALTAQCTIGETKVLLVKPQTFMNLSGDAVQAIVAYFKISPEDILIIHDDMDLDTGRIQFKASGGPAGHNGVANIQERLGTKELSRLRIGIGKPTPPIAPEDWVLGKMSTDDAPNTLDITSGMRDWIVYGTEYSASHWNGTQKKTL
jgi:PTH1 family peptidyl-tRNA hydrolase